ncbi:MAG: flagellar two component signal transduction system response regulator FlrC [Idiomarinaceae bacterium HL-53]|nr:MAG: flagellar two component signal transduction system response regulator FlrC [Idiomarinaceae bacterium HL-53]CUS48398.1 two-component system, response regulator FlrC [Idiomarinaceae bacterium HL-53]
MSHNKNILLVEDDPALRDALSDTLELNGYKVRAASSAEQALLMVKEQIPGLVLSDVQLGGISGIQLLTSLQRQGYDLPMIMMTAYAQVDDAVKAMRMGAVDYLSKPFATEQLLELIERYAPRVQELLTRPVVGDSSSEELLRLAQRVAQAEATVMISGPSGSGKEVLAQFIHHASTRRDGPFVAINCAAIPENMLEATLFGYEKGAFTGAVQSCVGKFEQANGGTLLLDEITEMDLGLQAKLLRVLQERRVERLGSRKEIQLDVRIVATSNRDLRDAVEQGRFREDLYYRLNVFPLAWKPLSQRPGDILPLAEHLLDRHCERANIERPQFTMNAQQKLVNYPWPGNVRELENVIQRALIMHIDGRIDATDIMLDERFHGFDLQEREAILPEQVLPEVPERLGNELKQQEQQIILDTLEKYSGKRKKVAEVLGISPRTLRYKLARMRDQGIRLP